MNKPNLFEERMHGQGGAYQNRQNYLKGLDELCIFHNINKIHKMLELGVNDGVSTSLFAFYAESVTAIDINRTSKLEYNLQINKNIIFIQGYINDILTTLPDNSFDFIYIDACHEKNCVLNDIEISIPKLKTNGVICGHDYIHDEPWDHGVRGAVDEFFKGKKINFFEDTSWSVVY